MLCLRGFFYNRVASHTNTIHLLINIKWSTFNEGHSTTLKPLLHS